MNATVAWDLLAKSLKLNSERVAIKIREFGWTYAELDDLSSRIAKSLISQTHPGQRVALLLGNSIDYVAADLAVQRSGLVKVPLNPMLSRDDITYIIKAAECSILFVSDRVHPDLSDIQRSVEHIGVRVIRLRHGRQSAADRPSSKPATRAVGPSDPATMLFTGGTTGRPKGILHSAGSVADNYLAHILEGEVREGERMLLSSALSHSAGLFLLAGLVRGATVHVESKFEAVSFVNLIATEEICWVSVVPTMLYRVLDVLEGGGGRLPSLRTLVYGSAPITAVRLAQALDILGPVLIQLYGQSEVPNWGTTLSKTDHERALLDPSLLTSCGRPSTMVDVSIRDEDDEILPAGATGEICLRAPYQMVEYWRNPTATAETIKDGWVHTRDVGYMDTAGYVFVKDRLSDMIITGGYNVYSSEVESAVQTLPGVAQVAAIGLPDADWGEAVCAVVVLKPEHHVTEDELLVGSRGVLTGYKRPKSVRIVREIPLTPFGKADKKLIRAQLTHDAMLHTGG